MPKNKVSDPITDQEIAFARLVLSGAMTDRQAAEAVGLNPDSAAYTKSKPHVRAYMLEHRAAVEEQLVQQEAEGLRRRNLDREKVLDRLWEIAKLSPEMTRGSITGQVKALAMIIAMQNFIPDRRVLSAAAPPPNPVELSSRLPRPSRHAVEPAVGPERSVPACRASVVEEPAVSAGPSHSTFPNRFTPSETPKPYAPLFGSVPDLGVSFPVKNPFVHPR
jgi:hypothetical protein